jgi:ribosomal protein S18 acetylase RimI-like enzyme
VIPVQFTTSLDGIDESMLVGFCVDWPSPMSPATHLRLLHGSHRVVLALDEDRVVGFVTAISDGVLSAYIPLLEVLPTWKGRGIGTELVRRMLDELSDLYMVDLLCDDDVAPFYERIDGMIRVGGFCVRNYAAQRGIGDVRR